MAERTLDALSDGHTPTPYQIKREHAGRMQQTYPNRCSIWPSTSSKPTVVSGCTPNPRRTVPSRSDATD